MCSVRPIPGRSAECVPARSGWSRNRPWLTTPWACSLCCWCSSHRRTVCKHHLFDAVLKLHRSGHGVYEMRRLCALARCGLHVTLSAGKKRRTLSHGWHRCQEARGRVTNQPLACGWHHQLSIPVWPNRLRILRGRCSHFLCRSSSEARAALPEVEPTSRITNWSAFTPVWHTLCSVLPLLLLCIAGLGGSSRNPLRILCRRR